MQSRPLLLGQFRSRRDAIFGPGIAAASGRCCDLQSTYIAAAELAGWDRSALERDFGSVSN